MGTHNSQGEVLSDCVCMKLGKAYAQPVAVMGAGAREGADGMKWCTKESATISHAYLFSKRKKNERTNV